MMYNLANERSPPPKSAPKDRSIITSDKQKFASSISNKKPRRCGASWFNIIISELVTWLLWS